VAVTCRVLGFSKQAFDRDWPDAHLINAAIDIHPDDPEFGYRFIADELPRPRSHREREWGLCGDWASAVCLPGLPFSDVSGCRLGWSMKGLPESRPNSAWQGGSA
jgi:hypothetical protein